MYQLLNYCLSAPNPPFLGQVYGTGAGTQQTFATGCQVLPRGGARGKLDSCTKGKGSCPLLSVLPQLWLFPLAVATGSGSSWFRFSFFPSLLKSASSDSLRGDSKGAQCPLLRGQKPSFEGLFPVLLGRFPEDSHPSSKVWASAPWGPFPQVNPAWKLLSLFLLSIAFPSYSSKTYWTNSLY